MYSVFWRYFIPYFGAILFCVLATFYPRLDLIRHKLISTYFNPPNQFQILQKRFGKKYGSGYQKACGKNFTTGFIIFIQPLFKCINNPFLLRQSN